jgi:hypothetical protein
MQGWGNNQSKVQNTMGYGPGNFTYKPAKKEEKPVTVTKAKELKVDTTSYPIHNQVIYCGTCPLKFLVTF